MIATSDYELVTEAVGLVARPGRTHMLVRGAEAADFLQGQLTNDVEALEPGSGCYAALLTHKGKIRTDLRVLRQADAFRLDAEPIARPVLAHMLDTYSLGRDVRWEDLTGRTTVLSLVGPAARGALDAAPPEVEHASVEGAHGLYVATDLGVDVICGAEDAEAVRAALGVDEVPEEAAECLRIEAGRARLGFDMDGDTIPEEALLNDRAVSFTKGCYVGQETVARLHYKGKPNRRLRGLRLSAPVSSGEPVLHGEKQVGTLGSTCVSPSLGPIGLSILRREVAAGDRVRVGPAEAEVVELPFDRP